MLNKLEENPGVREEICAFCVARVALIRLFLLSKEFEYIQQIININNEF